MNNVNHLILPEGRIFLWGEIDSAKAFDVICRIKSCVYSNLRDVYLYICSEGGDFEASCGIIDEISGAIKNRVNVCTIAIGKAYSCGALILAMGNERYATPNTVMMLHPISYEAPSDSVENQKRFAEFSEEHSNKVIDLIAAKCGYKTKGQKQQFKDEIKSELWMCPSSAIEFGLIDDIWNYKWEKNI